MMTREKLIAAILKYGGSLEETVRGSIGVDSGDIGESVVLAPSWVPDMLPALGRARLVSPVPLDSICVWDIETERGRLTYIKTGIGASVFTDVALALGLTPCKKAVFIGSVGAIAAHMRVGDLVIPEYSLSLDGASRYIFGDSLSVDALGEKALPDTALRLELQRNAGRAAAAAGVALHSGRTASVDCIFAEFAHLDELLAMGCDTVEMETAAAFRAANIMGYAMAALFCVSDNSLNSESLMGGILDETHDLRRRIRAEVFPEALLSTLLPR